MAKICCLILNYNDAKTTLKLLDLIKDYSIFSDILVVDNCSTDDSWDTLSVIEDIPLLTVIRTERNGGYGAGNNYGIRYAYEELCSDYVLLCNPDVRFKENVVDRLCSVMEHYQDCVISAAVQHDINDNEIREKAWKIPTALRYAFTFSRKTTDLIAKTHYQLDYFKKSEVVVGAVPGAMLMIRATTFLLLGGYDESMFLYCEEDTIGYKIQSKGYKTILVTDCYYLHEHGVSINKSIADHSKQLSLIFSNKLLFMKKYLSANYFELMIAKMIMSFQSTKINISKEYEVSNSCLLLTKYIPTDQNASQKAPSDIEYIFANQFGNTQRIYRTNRRFVRNIDLCISATKLFFNRNKKNTYLFVQWPLYSKKPFLDEFVFGLGYKAVIAIIHDVDSLQFYENEKKIKEDIRRYNLFDLIICHNETMMEWMKKEGVIKPIVPLHIFDYLISNREEQLDYDGNTNKKNVVIAGNLDKSTFLRDIPNFEQFCISAYGKLTKYELPKWIEYKGSFPPDQLPDALEGDYGLIWDGDDYKSCIGTNGRYMSVNNPHKLSLYIACGLPIITWKKAAIAGFVEKNRIGFCVDSLEQVDGIISQMENTKNKELKNNVNKIRRKLVVGHYTARAINEAIFQLEAR